MRTRDTTPTSHGELFCRTQLTPDLPASINVVSMNLAKQMNLDGLIRP
jgi:hypothetical protein